MLSLLENININGRSGLDVVIQTWCENAETFQGFWVTRTSTLALIDLFVSARPSLQSLQVKGDLIVKAETKDSMFCDGLDKTPVDADIDALAVIMTRSRTKKSEPRSEGTLSLQCMQLFADIALLQSRRSSRASPLLSRP